ncbi:hypothetical protein CARUB_v10007025mg, partial [Capsella rubella]
FSELTNCSCYGTDLGFLRHRVDGLVFSSSSSSVLIGRFCFSLTHEACLSSLDKFNPHPKAGECCICNGSMIHITYTKNYFQELYDLAEELIPRGHGYVISSS